MYGGSSKLGGRGGGRGGGANGTKRHSSFPPPPPLRSSTAPTSRLSLGGGSNPRNRAGPSPSAPASVEETFSLVPGNNPLTFAMIIRLVPDLVEEIRRVEAQGGTARIKFDSVGSNDIGNVIDVGGKEFKFTWSKEYGDLCDIYEERQSGEGNGLLVETGSAWRKVNVQRILDESTKNHVKMRSEEAERKHKSRKAICLDTGNPSMKNQIKQMALAETTPWRYKQKKEPPYKKQKVDPPTVSKSTFKAVVSSTASAKSRRSCSPLPSTPEQPGTLASPFGSGNSAKINVSTIVTPTQSKIKENANNLDKEIQTRPVALRETAGQKVNFGSKPMDLQSMLIALLMENPKGVTLKALEKAIGEKAPNSAKKIEPIIKKIANYQAPGKYILKPGVDESFKKPSSESGSSPEDNRQQEVVLEGCHDHGPTLEPRFSEKSPAVGFEEHAQSNAKFEDETNEFEKIDNQQHSPANFGEKKTPDNSEGQPGSSSDSGSDSDSGTDSSDSGSDSGSRSKSPAGSGSGSSSDSESDASSNSKQGSDEDVDILSDGDKEPQAPQVLPSPQNRTDDDVDIDDPGSVALDIAGHESDTVDIEKDLADDEKEVDLTANDNLDSGKEDEKLVEGANYVLDHLERQNFIGTLFDDNENTVHDSYRDGLPDSPERISKRDSDSRHFDEKSEPAKKMKVENSARMLPESWDAHPFESPHNRDIEEIDQGPSAQDMNRQDRDGNSEFGSQRAYSQASRGKPNLDSQQPRRKSSDKNARLKGSDNAGKSKHAESSGHALKKSSNVHENSPIQREKPKETQNEDNFVEGKKMPRNSKEGGPGGKHSSSDSHHRKQGETFGKFKDAVQITSSQMGSSPKDVNRVDVDKHPASSGRSLQRELSELELGELREPLPEELPVKKKFDRKGSFKQSENERSISDNYNSDLSRAKPFGKAKLDPVKPSPANPLAGFKKTPDHHIEDLAKSHHNKLVQSHPPHHSKADNSRSRHTDNGGKVGNSTESNGESQKRVAANVQQLHDPKRGPLSHPMKESKAHSSNTVADLLNGQTDTVVNEVNNNARKKRGSSSEDETSTYSKYDKDVPEMKGPIKDHSLYEEYVQEYRDKYDSYCSLNKILENYRNDFSKMGKDLEFAKGRDQDRYNKILGLLKDSYRQCGSKHRRLKKIFIILHEELKNLKQRIKDYALSYSKD